MRDERGLGAGTKERSYYPALADLLNSVGQELKPRVLCLSDLANSGAGHPDFGLYAANQVQKGEPRKGQQPERGVIELKGVADDTWLTADTKQVSKYFGAYRLVIVSNLRDFLIIGEGPNGEAAKQEGFRLAPNAKAFWEMVSTPRKSAEIVGRAFGEYLKRTLTQSVSLRQPKDVAWFLASYARDALQRVDEAGDLPALANVRASLEQALGVTFEAEKGNHFFRSTLVQTLFYGIFSAWVLWAREEPRTSPKFDWKLATWHLTVPFIRTLFQQIASPAHLQPLHLVEVLDWTAATLNRVDTTEFFARFNDADAVQFFYEPFLEAFDPELRKELGVWYTPNEVVTYMVARVDKALREDLGIEDGLASERVYVLDPCCGTGAFLGAVLKRMEASFDAKGLGGLKGQMVKQAALTRVFGFEIMPAPFVVAHLQVGLTLQGMGATLDGTTDRAGIFLTNALTGWEPHVTKPLPFPELEEERSRADKVKQGAPILVIIGNPPYNGFAGVNEGKEERALTDAYKRPKKVRKPEGQGLNDLYVRFFRMAERRIVQTMMLEKQDLLDDPTPTWADGGEGIVCFISNYSWLDGLSFTAMRERYLEAYDAIRIDCLNGDKYKTGKTTPDGAPDPSIFSTEHNREGIQVGTAIATMIRKEKHSPPETVQFRHLWGANKRQELLATAEADTATLYQTFTPPLELGYPFASATLDLGYFDWPRLYDLMPFFFPGVQTKRDSFLVDIDKNKLVSRLEKYFDPKVSDAEIAQEFPEIWHATKRYQPIETREILKQRGIIPENFVSHAYRPFDVRWIYWEPETKLLGEKSAEYWPNAWQGNLSICAQQKSRSEWQSTQLIHSLGCLDLIDRGASIFPKNIIEVGDFEHRYNLSKPIETFFSNLSVHPDNLFSHVISVLHAPEYRTDHGDALRMDWPRVPIPGDADLLRRSAGLGEALSLLLNPEAAAPGISTGVLRSGLRIMGLPATCSGEALGAADLTLTAGWGSTQKSEGRAIVMPGRGLTQVRDYTPAERVALDAEAQTLGMTLDALLTLIGTRTLDVHLNANAYWSNVPEKVWGYALGGYQVIKKWLSYREQSVLGRPLKLDEALYVSQMVRRVAAILIMGPELDANYRASAADAQSYEALGLSRDAARERKGAKEKKRGLSNRLTPAMKANRKDVKKQNGS
ncbi:type ISP restriction/modification enzyme [Sinorhizobium sp. A49]|uniref:type ISP restriction/modification enzyme n=1 Tax=Sinorhizobium sp. A49 TaxID=1945861 RepID=UPI001AECD206|nr:type ISP restriction/modification enzyme [Sinorhizobium sp. A49]